MIAADVFEHILLEQEPLFVSKCVSALKPGGRMIISVPHQGTFAYLDPYQVKPTIHRTLARLGLYKGVHNGCCDIRKGHKHYSLEELTDKFSELTRLKSSLFWISPRPAVLVGCCLVKGFRQITRFFMAAACPWKRA